MNDSHSNRIDTVSLGSDTATGSTKLPQPPNISSFKLIGTLTFGGLVAGLLIVLVYQLTLPSILQYRTEQMELAVKSVLQQPDRIQTRYRVHNRLQEPPPAGVKPQQLEKVFFGYRSDGSLKGVAIAAAEPGFQDLIQLIFGYDPAAKRLYGMKVLGHKETPGLGDKIILDLNFVNQFQSATTPLKGVKIGKGSSASNEIDMITGATISSKAIIKTINNAILDWQPALDAEGVSQ